MIKSYKGREINYDKPVRVYRNLHNGLLSIKQGTLVVAHADQITLGGPDGAHFIISEVVRERVVKNGVKEVHAYAVGRIVEQQHSKDAARIYYNPYKAGYFHREGMERVDRVREVTIDSEGVMRG